MVFLPKTYMWKCQTQIEGQSKEEKSCIWRIKHAHKCNLYPFCYPRHNWKNWQSLNEVHTLISWIWWLCWECPCLRKYTLNYLRVIGHHVYNLLLVQEKYNNIVCGSGGWGGVWYQGGREVHDKANVTTFYPIESLSNLHMGSLHSSVTFL